MRRFLVIYYGKSNVSEKDRFENECHLEEQNEIIFNKNLFEDDEDEKHHEWNRDPIEREWGYKIRPYKEAVHDEMDAEQRELDLWMMKPANITLKIERE